MGLLKTIKQALRTDEGAEEQPKEEQQAETAEDVDSESETSSQSAGRPTTDATLLSVLQQPHVTEKATKLSEDGQYVFRVRPDATKVDVRRAVEALYDVNVRSVRTIWMPAKQRRQGQHVGVRSGYKKAIVSVGQDDRIDILPH